MGTDEYTVQFTLDDPDKEQAFLDRLARLAGLRVHTVDGARWSLAPVLLECNTRRLAGGLILGVSYRLAPAVRSLIAQGLDGAQVLDAVERLPVGQEIADGVRIESA